MTFEGVIIRDFVPLDTASAITLWDAFGLTRPWNDPQKDISRKMTDRNGYLWVADESGVIVGSIMVGYSGNCGSINILRLLKNVKDLDLVPN